MSEVPSSQLAWRIHRRGHPRDVLSLDSIPLPTLKDGQVLVRIQACGLNPIGYKLMTLAPNIVIRRPVIAEHDFAGFIVDSNNVPNFNNGDLVWGVVPVPRKDGQGALAQYVAATEAEVSHRPSNLSLEEAAGLGVVGITAYKVLFRDSGVQLGQIVFVKGGSSSLGGIAIKMLKAKRCTVWSSCSAKNMDLVKSFGADKVFDYRIKSLHDQLIEEPPSPKFHAIFDAVGGYELYTHSEAYLAPSGLYASPGSSFRSIQDLPNELWGFFNAMLLPIWLGGTNRKYRFLSGENTKQMLDLVTELVEKGPAAPHIDSVYEFEDVLSAYERIMTNRATGKVIVKVS